MAVLHSAARYFSPSSTEDIHLNCGYYADIIVEQEAVVELKSVERILPVHEAQTLTYLRPSGCRVGLLMNFNCVLLVCDASSHEFRRAQRINLALRSLRSQRTLRNLV